jgi:hypothetical protein
MRFEVTDDSRPRYEAYLHQLSRVVDSCVDFLDEGAQAVIRSYNGNAAGDLAVLMLVRHLMESIDGVSILMSRGSAQPCEPLLRSGFEALLGIRFIWADDSERRGIAYLVGDIRRSIRAYRHCDPDDELGKKLRRQATPEIIASLVGQVPVEDARRFVEALRADLDHPDLQPIHQEWEKAPSAAWYSLFGGPKTIEQLAEKVNLGAMYTLRYRHWSCFTHAADTMRNLHASADAVLLRPLRHPDELVGMLRFALVLTSPVAVQLIQRYAPDRAELALKRHKDLCGAVKSLEATGNISWKDAK